MTYNFFKMFGIVAVFLCCRLVESKGQTPRIAGTWILDTIIQEDLKLPVTAQDVSPDEIAHAYYSMFAEVDLFFSADGKVFFVNLEERDPGGFYSAGTKSNTYEWIQEEGDTETYPIDFLSPGRIQITLVNGVKMIFNRSKTD